MNHAEEDLKIDKCFHGHVVLSCLNFLTESAILIRLLAWLSRFLLTQTGFCHKQIFTQQFRLHKTWATWDYCLLNQINSVLCMTSALFVYFETRPISDPLQ